MTSSADKRHEKEKKRNPRAALDPLVAPPSAATSTGGASRMQMVGNALLAPFTSRRNDSNRMLADLAPVLMSPRMVHAAATVSSKSRAAIDNAPSRVVDFATLGRAPARLTLGTRRITSRDLQIVEATDELLAAAVPDPDGHASSVSLMRGFNATIPSAEKGRSRRRQARNVDTPRMGLKKMGMHARGMLGGDEEVEKESVVSEEDLVLVNGKSKSKEKKKRRGRESLAAVKTFGKEELARQTSEIQRDKENIAVRRALINNEIDEITHKIEALDAMRIKLEQDLLKLQEDELELDDELQGVQERIEMEEAEASQNRTHKAAPLPPHHIAQSSRRRKGPAFLPSEHDELPPGVAFMTLQGHSSPIIALDFSEPYGTLVSASGDDGSPRVYDLASGEALGRLRGHAGTVKCVQVEDHVCLTGGEDGAVRLWDLRRAGEDDKRDGWELGDVPEEPEFDEFGAPVEGVKSGQKEEERGGPCVRVLEGHSKAVTSMYFEDDCLVTGASDKTLRQWDLTTGQCVMTMDILWAIAHPPSSSSIIGSGGALPAYMLPGAAAAAGTFAVPTPPYADGSWEMYQDFVGGVQFWEYALVSGSGDGVVRMWDMRAGQAHRTLLGHTAPVTCLQFDENHIVSGSLDKSIRIWDLRTGGIFDTIKYDHAVTALQFDTRKIVAATGENGVKIYNRTSMQQSTLLTNGHMKPVERLRYIDRYLVSGGRDSMVKIWAL